MKNENVKNYNHGNLLKGLELGEIKEFRMFEFTSIRKEIESIANTKEQSERIHVFLSIVWFRNNYHTSQLRNELKNGIFSDDEIDEDCITNTVFTSYKERRTLLTKSNMFYFIQHLEALHIISTKKMKGKYGKDALVIQLLPKLLLSKKKYINKYSSNVQKSINTFFGLYISQLGTYYPIFKHNYRNRFKITEKTFVQAMTVRYQQKEDKLKLSLEQYLKNNHYVFEKMKILNENINLANSLFFYKKDNFSGRNHSLFTSLPKSIRNCIQVYDRRTGKYTNKLCELDIKNSQALFFAKNVLRQYGYSRFAEIANEGEDIYTDIMKEYKGEKIWKYRSAWWELNDRDTAKRFCFNMMFMNAYTRDNEHSVSKRMIKFREKYGNEGKYIMELQKGLKKNSRKNIVARQMQALEVKACEKIYMKLVDAKINFVDVFDSLIIPEYLVDETKKIMEEVLDEELKGVRYCLHKNKLNCKILYNKNNRWKKKDKECINEQEFNIGNENQKEFDILEELQNLILGEKETNIVSEKLEDSVCDTFSSVSTKDDEVCIL